MKLPANDKEFSSERVVREDLLWTKLTELCEVNFWLDWRILEGSKGITDSTIKVVKVLEV